MRPQARVGYLGPEGSFTHEAALRWMARRGLLNACEVVALPDLPSLFAAGGNDRVRWVVCPLENSLEGSVVLAVDLWIRESTLFQVDEVVLAVHQWLLGPPGTRAEAVHQVLSHPHALAQVRRTLRALVPGATLVPCPSTAEAARRVAANPNEPWVAVGSQEAAARYGLAVLYGPLEDGTRNVTRFGVLGRDRPGPTGADRTTVVVGGLVDRPGLLKDLLDEFASRRINLTRIESRPSRERLGSYVFLMDMEGHADEPALRAAMAAVRRHATYVRLLGSYPRDEAAS